MLDPAAVDPFDEDLRAVLIPLLPHADVTALYVALLTSDDAGLNTLIGGLPADRREKTIVHAAVLLALDVRELAKQSGRGIDPLLSRARRFLLLAGDLDA